MKLLELRKQNKLTQQELADKLKINNVTYYGYEKGRNKPDIETLIKIADFYKVSLDYLCDRKKPYSQELGYLDEKTLAILKLTQELTDKNKDQAFYYISGLVAGQ